MTGKPIPEVTDDVRTAVLWAVIEGRPSWAREMVTSMSAEERGVFVDVLTEIVNMLWGVEA